MRITLLTNEYPPHVYGGAGVHVQYLSRELARLDGGRHEVQVHCFGDQREHGLNYSVEGVHGAFNFPFQDPRHQKLWEALFLDIIMTGSVRETDIVHCHTWYTHLAGCLIKQIAGVPLVITTHSLEPDRPWKEEQLGSAYRATTWLEKTAYQNADGVIAVSESMEAAAHDLYNVPFERIRVIRNGIDLDEYQPKLNPSLLTSYHIDPDKPYLLFVGRITRQKGITHLVHAIKYLSPEIQIVLCAGAPDTEEIGREMEEEIAKAQAQTSNEIIWIRQWVPKTHLVPLLSHASVFVCPSVYEPFGIVNLEAMACGTPVVASAVGGIPEAIVHDETGLLVPFQPVDTHSWEPREPEKFSKDLANAVNSLLSSPERMKTMGIESRRRIEGHFSWERIARETLAFYQELTSESHP